MENHNASLQKKVCLKKYEQINYNYDYNKYNYNYNYLKI